MKKRILITSSALAALMLLASACGSPTVSPQSGSPVALADYQESATLAAFRGVSYDYEPYRSTDAMAEAVPLVIDGVIGSVQEGRTSVIVGTDRELSTSVVLVVVDVAVLRGDTSEGDGRVYIELDGGGQDVKVYEEGFPEGARIVAYLGPAWDGEAIPETDVEIPDGAAGRPEGEPLHSLAGGPQGFAVQVEGHDVVWPLLGVTSPGLIEQFEPGGPLIPG